MSWDKRKDELRDQVVRQTNKRKPTAKWCKGKEGREHTPEIVVNHNYAAPAQLEGADIRAKFECRWYPIYYSYLRRDEGPRDYRYTCVHALKCTNCGKYVEYFLKPEQCPDATPKPAI